MEYPPFDRIVMLTQHQAFMGMGGTFVLSDDSHGVDQIGTNYDKVMEFLEKAEIMEVYALERIVGGVSSDRLDNTIFRRIPVQELKEHRFWQSRK